MSRPPATRLAENSRKSSDTFSRCSPTRAHSTASKTHPRTGKGSSRLAWASGTEGSRRRATRNMPRERSSPNGELPGQRGNLPTPDFSRAGNVTVNVALHDDFTITASPATVPAGATNLRIDSDPQCGGK